jgi:hypothetical protein
MDAGRKAAWSAMEGAREDTIRVARELHDDPELAWHEERAAARLTDLLEAHGFTVERGLLGMPTAFRATKLRHDSEQMRKGLRHGHVAYLVEYDALPDVGHAEGHHLGAGAGVLAAIGLAGALAQELGTVTVFGCPAGTEPGAKARMTAAGLFDAPDVALGAHPAPPGEGYFYTIDDSGPTLAEQRVTVSFDDPSATERVLAAQELFRQDLEEHDEVRLRAAGGAVEIAMRARGQGRTRQLRGRLREQLYAAVGAPPASLEDAPFVDAMLVNRVLARRMKTCADNLGLRMDDIIKEPPTRVTDWGNVSRVVSAFEGLFPITTEPVAWGEAAFADAAHTDEAYTQMARMAECLCFTGIDVLRDMNFRAITDSQLVKGLKALGVERPFRRWLGVHPVLPPDAINGKTQGNGQTRGPRRLAFDIVRGPGLPPPRLFLDDDEDDEPT